MVAYRLGMTASWPIVYRLSLYERSNVTICNIKIVALELGSIHLSICIEVPMPGMPILYNY